MVHGGVPLYSFEQVDSSAPEGRVRAIRLCWPRHFSYRATLVVSEKAHSFDLTFCPWLDDPARLHPDDCVAFRGVPTLARLTPEPAETTAPSVFEHGVEQFEFFWADAFSETVRRWFAEEWRQVDPSLLFALAEWLSASVQTSNNYTNEAKLLLPLLPVEQIRRADGARVTVDPTTTALCDDTATAPPGK